MSNNEHGSSRRTVLKGAAWAAPAIVAATAVPAMAASTDNLDVTPFTGTRAGGQAELSFGIKNNATASFTGAITVTITVTATGATGPAAIQGNAGGWTLGSVALTATGFTVTASRGSTTLAAGASIPEVRFRFNSALAGTASAVVTTPSSTQNDTASASFPGAI